MDSIENIKERSRNAINGMDGWCSDEKSDKLVELIHGINAEICVEIGVFAGKSLIPQALTLKENNKGIIYGIDPWKNETALEEMKGKEHIEWWGNLDIESIYVHCQENIISLGLETFVKLIRAKSEDVVDQFADGSIDLLHIDGNHSEALSYKDATLYLPKVKSGGFIVFDDIWWTEENSYVTTRKAITHLLESCDRTDLINNDCLVLQRV